jgi:hypothetical protein
MYIFVWTLWLFNLIIKDLFWGDPKTHSIQALGHMVKLIPSYQMIFFAGNKNN